jgi:hypothetical protein
VAAAGTTTPVIGPADVTVAEGTHTVVYAWGSLAENTLQLAVQNIEGLHSAPAGVPGARAGAADAGTGSAGQTAATVGIGAAALLLLAGGVAVSRKNPAPRRIR